MSWHISEEQHRHPHEFIGDSILGLNDGIVTTLVFALSVAGAARYSTVVLAGLAEMFAGGVAMFLGAFMSAQSQREATDYQIAVEREEIEQEPEEEREELRQIYREKGFSGRQLTGIVDHLTSDKELWLDSMIRDELLLRPGQFRSPGKVASVVGGAFVIGALVPILPFLIALPKASVFSAALSITALFVTGAARSRYSHRPWLAAGAQMVIIGAIGTAAGVVIGKLLATGIRP